MYKEPEIPESAAWPGATPPPQKKKPPQERTKERSRRGSAACPHPLKRREIYISRKGTGNKGWYTVAKEMKETRKMRGDKNVSR